MTSINAFRLLAVILILITGCSKMEDKKSSGDSNTPDRTQNQPGKEDNSRMRDNSSGQTDETAAELVKEADESITAYSSGKSEEAKKETIAKCLAAGNYLTFEANLPAREKYRPALKYYRKVLELDPQNEEALKNKKQIEDIYIQMGMPIPE